MQNLKDFLQNWITILSAIAAFLGTLFATWKKIKAKFFQAGIDRRKNLRLISESKDALIHLASKTEQIDEMLGRDAADHTMLKNIEAMLRPNGGGSIFDAITRMEKQMAINQTAQRLVLIEDTAIMFWCDADGYNTRVSKAYAELVGRSPDEMIGAGWKSHIAASCREAVAKEWYFAVRDRREFYMRLDMENRATHRIITADVTALPAKVNGNVVGYVGRITLVQPGQ